MPKQRHSISTFQESWLSDTKYKSWIKRAKSEKMARCDWCKIDLDLTTMGKSAVDLHITRSKKHQEIQKSREGASAMALAGFTKDTKSGSASTSGDCEIIEPNTKAAEVPKTITGQQTLDTFQIPKLVSEAEIKWILKVVMSHMSYRSCLDLCPLFQSMFPDSAIAKKMSLSKTKCAYTINFGLADYFKEQLLSEVKASPLYVLSFDESLNPVSQSCQMDCGVRYWDSDEGIAKARYLDSKFIHRPNAKNLLGEILKATSSLGLAKLLQLSRDGPHVNEELLRLLIALREEKEFPGLLEIGSCGLHVIHGAFKTGMESQADWKLKKIFKAMFYLFHDSPARREVFLQETGSSLFAKRFCPTRWIESVTTAERAIKIWPNIVKVIKEWEKKAKSYRPSNASYSTLVEFHLDKFVPLRMEFFRYVAKMMQEYLLHFQTDRPMLPFVADSLEEQMRNLMKIVIKPSVVEEAKTPFLLMKVDLDKADNRLVTSLNIGTALKQMLNAVKPKQEEKKKFLSECSLAVVSLLKKLQERSPLNYALCRNASSLSPNQMVNDKASSVMRFKGFAEGLSKIKLITTDEADQAKSQYESFIGLECQLNKEEFIQFNHTTHRIDSFFGKFLPKNDKYKSLWKVIMITSVTSTGQATIERGFSVNKEVVDTNMQELSLVSQRIIYDQIKANGVKLQEYKISSDMLKACAQSHKKYERYMADKKEDENSEAKKQEIRVIDEQIAEVQNQKANVKDTIKSLLDDADKYCFQAEKENDLTLLTKANSFRNTAKDKEKTLKELEIALVKLNNEKEEKKKNLGKQ